MGLACAGASENRIDEVGRLEHIALGRGWMPLSTDIKIPLKGWSKVLSLSESKPVYSSISGTRSWRGTLTDGATAAFAVEQFAREKDGKLIFEVRATAQKEVETEGVFFWIDVPSDTFAGGSFRAAKELGTLPLTLPEEIHLCNAVTFDLALKSPTGAEIVAEMVPAAAVVIQDGRKWAKNFSVLVRLHYGKMVVGQNVTMQIVLSTSGDVESAPAKVSLDGSKPHYKIAGIGGNYCFGIESPVTRYTLDNLNVAFARTEMTLEQWEPENDDADAAKTNWAALVAHDLPDSRLRHEFELMQEFGKNKIPFIASVWKLPGWLYTHPPDAKNENNRVDETKWPEVLECIGSYLQYAKEKYQAEPAYFSFNEANIGVRVLFSAEEHRDLVKRLGAHLEKAGLKTKLLLGDVGGPRDTQSFVAPSAADADALKYAGAVSFHSWNGATPAQYSAWADLAEKLKLPLIVAEGGVDPAAWQGGAYQNFDYGVREMTHYLELLQYARPQAILFWEFTGDYSLLTTNKFNKKRLVLTERFCFQKHWCDLIPAGSEALKAPCDNANVLCAAFRHTSAEGKAGCTIHLGNPKWSHPAIVEGIPPEIKTLNVVRTSKGELFKKQEALPVVDGKVTLDLPAQSLTTLTTLEIPALKEP